MRPPGSTRCPGRSTGRRPRTGAGPGARSASGCSCSRGRRPRRIARRDSPSASASWRAGTPSIGRSRRRRGHSSSELSTDPAPLLDGARPASVDGPARRPEARQRRAPRRRPGGLHRLADDGPRAGRGGARLDARLEQRRAFRSSRRHVLERYRERPPGRRRLDAPRRSWQMGDDRPPPGADHRPVRTLPPRGLDATIGDWAAQVDLTWIVGLLLRGWRKGLDAEAGETLASGVVGGRRPGVLVRCARSRRRGGGWPEGRGSGRARRDRGAGRRPARRRSPTAMTAASRTKSPRSAKPDSTVRGST